MKVIAIDPGETTGWAAGTIDGAGSSTSNSAPRADRHLTVTASGFHPWKTFVLALFKRQMGPDPYDVIVYEAWRLRLQSARGLVGSDLQSSQCIGCVKLCGWLSHAALVSQEPAIKPVIDKIKGGKGYLPKSSVEHDRDALRHLWYFAIKKEGVL